jgi:Na+-translocating ferredoxin:NAD+ oxidoreductase RnfD subunit
MSKPDTTPWNRLQKFLRTPKGYVILALVLLTVVGGLTPQGNNGIRDAAVAVAAGVLFDALVARVLKRHVTFSTGAVITGLIVADVLSGLTPLYVVVATTLMALASKHLLKRGRKPIFNPAAVGLLISLAVFSTAQSWWAGMPLLPLWNLALLLAVGIFVAVRVGKYAQVLTFLGTYFVLLFGMAFLHLGLASATPADALRTPFLNSALYLAFFMMTDPPTTPATIRGQIQFAMIAAVVSVIVFGLWGGLAYPLVGLLVANLWAVWLAAFRKPAAEAIPAAPSRVWRQVRAHPVAVAVVVGLLVSGGALTAIFSSHGQSPLSGLFAFATSSPSVPTAASSEWKGSIRASVGAQGGTVLQLTGPWQGDKLVLTLNGFSSEGGFVVQGGEVTLLAGGGTWRGPISPGPGQGTFKAVLTASSGEGPAIHLTIGQPTFAPGGTAFQALVKSGG